MALPAALGLAGVAAGGGTGLALGLAGTAAGMIGARRQQKKQNALNEAAFQRQKALEEEAHRRNYEGVYSLLARPFERYSMIPATQRAYLSGLTPEAQTLGDQIFEKMQRIQVLQNKPEPTDADVSELESLGNAVADLTGQKQTLEQAALTAERDRYADLLAAGDRTARGLFDTSILAREQAAMDPLQSLRATVAPLREGYLPQIEAAETSLTDPALYDRLQELALARAESGRSPLTDQLRLDAADVSHMADLQRQRESMADLIAGNAQRALAEQENTLGASRVYGGSSTAMNRARADVMLDALAQAANARSSARMANLQENEAFRRAHLEARMANEADRLGIEQLLADTRLRNEQQDADLNRQRRANELNAILRRRDTQLQGVQESMQTADEKQRLQLNDIQRQMQNISLGDQLVGRAQARLSQPLDAANRLAGLRQNLFAPFRVGVGNYRPPAVPVPQATINASQMIGGLLKPWGNHLVKQSAGDTAFNRQNQLMQQSHKNQRELQQDYMNRRFGNPANMHGPANSPWPQDQSFNPRNWYQPLSN